MVSKYSLGEDVCRAISEAKSRVFCGMLTTHKGMELSRLASFAREGKLYEYQVGQDRSGERGSRRIVFYTEGRILKRVFFTEGHYHLDSWYEIRDY